MVTQLSKLLAAGGQGQVVCSAAAAADIEREKGRAEAGLQTAVSMTKE